MASTVKTYTNTSSWVCPPGVTSIKVEANGGGGGGGALQANTNKGAGGGAGGQYSVKNAFAVVPGTTYTVTIGGRGAAGAGTGNGGVGGDTWFSSNDANGVVAKGGAGGLSNENGATGGVGSTTGGVGDTVQKGGSGGSGAGSTAIGGGGGEGASAGADGNTGTAGTSGGAGGTGTAGGDGAAGGNNADGASTTNIGGGGGGAGTSGTTNRAGGQGGAGQLVLTYTTPKTEALKEDWSGGSINSVRWNDWSSGHASVVSSQLKITSAAVNTNAYYGVDSNTGTGEYDLTASYVQSQLVDAGSTSIPSWEVLPIDMVNNTTNGALRFIITGFSGTPSIICRYFDGSNHDNVAATYDAAVHKYFRIREASGTIYWDVSADGITWTNLFSVATPISLSPLRIGQQSGNWQNEAGLPTFAVFDNFNILPRVDRQININQSVKRAGFY